MSQIRHIGNHFVLGRQGRDVAKISETQLLECLEILKAELADGAGENVFWPDVIEYLQDQKEKQS